MKSLIWRANRKRYSSRHSTSGFTLIELLVVIIIIGILFAISAVGWDAIMNRERVSTVREQVTQVIRQAQTDARRSNIPRIVVFDPAAAPPRVAIIPRQDADAAGNAIAFPVNAATVSGIRNWQTLGNGEISGTSLEVQTFPAGANNQILFDNNGAIAQASANRAAPINPANPRIFTVNIRQRNTSVQTQRCVVVSTLLGSLRKAEGNQCPTS
jgi:prepilin-type N-terminal cleavage/methylation domain-containing protein